MSSTIIGAAIFERPVLERLARHPYRQVALRRKACEVYDNRCAMSGLMLGNRGGRPEVQAAYIRPVEHSGSDSARNGLALSSMLHRMFDRGLISVADDDETILVTRNKVPGDVVDLLLRPDGKIWKLSDERYWPQPTNPAWHPENTFGQMAADGPALWK